LLFALLHCFSIYIANWNNRICDFALSYPNKIGIAQANGRQAWCGSGEPLAGCAA